MDKLLFSMDNYNYLLENEKYDYYYELINGELDYLFNNENDYNSYIVRGVIDRGYNGLKDCVYIDKIYDSIYDAILGAVNGQDCILRIYEGNYGRLYLCISHHDSNNIFEIREVTKKGEDLLDYQYEIYELLERKGTTRNVKYIKRYSK